jgi:tetratricopeptide (TPR) repeat protein
VRLLAAIACVLLIPAALSGQENGDLRDADSSQQAVREIAAAAQRTNDAKAAFVVALRRFVEGLGDGDDRPQTRAAVAEMNAALARWDAALRNFRVALSSAGDSAEGHVALGTMFLDRGLASEAVDQFRRATGISPRWAEAWLLLGLAYEGLGKRDDAARALTAAARAKPDSATIGYARVQFAVRSGVEAEISRALLEFRDRHDREVRPVAVRTQAAPFVKLGLLRESPGVAPVFAPARYAEAIRLLNGRRYSEAVASFQHALDTPASARDERARLAAAESLLAAGQVEDAQRALTETVAALPESGQAYYRLGRLSQSQSRMPEAVAAFAAASERAVIVGRDSLYETIAALRVADGDFAAAIAAYRRELDANPNNAAAHRRLGDLYAQDGRLGEALAEYAAALSIEPRDADAHASRAHALLRLSRFSDAEAAARVAVALKPDHAAAQYALGTALMRTERMDEGLSVLQEFERLQADTRARNDAAWQITLLKDQARAQAAREDYAAAADLLRRAMTYAPTDGSIPLAAGALLMKAGKYEEAIPLLKDALERGAPDAQRYLADANAALEKTGGRR